MAFNFGPTQTTQPSLFGTPAPSTTSTGFTGFGTGGTGFGSFGTPTSTTGTATGFGGFGTGATTTTTSSLFGGFGKTTTTTPFSFGTATTSAPTGFGGFGAGTTGGFGTGATTGGFGTGVTTGGFGTGATTGGFGTGATTGGFGAGTTTGGFGAGTTTGFGAGLGAGTTTGFGGFGVTGNTGGGMFGKPGLLGGTTNAGTGLFGVNQPQNAFQQEEANLANIAMAVSLPQIYGDERDAIIAKWNQLQAYWGTGKGFYSSNGIVEFKPDNPFCRFKALGYHLIPKGSNEVGQLAIVLARKEAEVTAAQQQIVDTLHRILGSKPTLSVCVEGIRPLPEDKTEVVIYVLERPTSGPAKRVAANDLFNFFNQASQKSQISSQLNVVSLLPKVGWTDEQLKEYLAKPPAGVDPLLWQQAKLDNPDPEIYIPVPMIGFKELQGRLRHQAEQTKLYQQRLDVILSDLTDLQTQHTTMLSKLEDYKHKTLELGHRVLKVIVKQEIYRKMGFAIQAEEESLKVQLEQLHMELNHPTQFKGRLNELMSQMRMQLQTGSGRTGTSYKIDEETQTEIKQMLKQQQEGLQHLISIIKDDAANLQLIEQTVDKSHT